MSTLCKPNELIDRWRLTVDLFGRVFCDDVGLEPASIIRQLGGFQLKEAKFRREMERLRNIANRELLMEVDRDRDLLLQMTFKSLNNMYNLQNNRRAAAAAAAATSTISSSSSNQLLPPPLCLNRIKVTFKDEQGEGSGVARSFYTAFAEAVLADACLPSLDSFYAASTPTASNMSSSSSLSYVPFNMLHRFRNSGRGIDARRMAPNPSTPSNIPVPTALAKTTTTTASTTASTTNSTTTTTTTTTTLANSSNPVVTR
jgi:E3 ubiquitin-protein ligase EDD1